MPGAGEPIDVLQLRNVEVPGPEEGQLLLRFLQAPINPSDINTVQGKYPIKPQLPATPGHEGVAEVLAVGDKVRTWLMCVYALVYPLETNSCDGNPSVLLDAGFGVQCGGPCCSC